MKNYEYLVWRDGNLVLENYLSNLVEFVNALCLRALSYPEEVRQMYGIIRSFNGTIVYRVSTQSIIQGVRALINRMPPHCYISGPNASSALESRYNNLKSIKHGRKEVLFYEWKRMANF